MSDEIDAKLKEANFARIGQITSVSGDKKHVGIQLLGKTKLPNGDLKNAPILPDVPVWNWQMGDYNITVEPLVGAPCVVIFNDRSLDEWKKSEGGLYDPKLPRAHDWSDGICIPGAASPGGSHSIKEGITLENKEHFLNIKDGDFTIECKKFNIKAEQEITLESQSTTTFKATTITLDTPMTVITGSLSQGVAAAARGVRAAIGGLTAIFAGAFEIRNTLRTTNTIHADGKISSSTEVSAKTIDLTKHVHTGVASGGATSGEPKP